MSGGRLSDNTMQREFECRVFLVGIGKGTRVRGLWKKERKRRIKREKRKGRGEEGRGSLFRRKMERERI